jgi:hypothetical protein
MNTPITVPNHPLTEMVSELNTCLQQRLRLITRLRRDCGHRQANVADPEALLYRLLKEREIVISLLKQSGAVKQVGGENIVEHLDWLIPKFLRPVRWPGRVETKPLKGKP